MSPASWPLSCHLVFVSGIPAFVVSSGLCLRHPGLCGVIWSLSPASWPLSCHLASVSGIPASVTSFPRRRESSNLSPKYIQSDTCAPTNQVEPRECAALTYRCRYAKICFAERCSREDVLGEGSYPNLQPSRRLYHLESPVPVKNVWTGIQRMIYPLVRLASQIIEAATVSRDMPGKRGCICRFSCS